MRLIEGEVPTDLPEACTVTATYQISRNAFLLKLPMGLSFYYRQSYGTVFARSSKVPDSEVSLFFAGSVYGAIAWLNELAPLHASAVSYKGKVFAFTGGSGEGKSTLAAALALRGFELCSDDVLVLDLCDPTQVIAIPSHARLKLWGDALALTKLAGTGAVRLNIDKYYVEAGIAFERAPTPMKRLYFLESAGSRDSEITPVGGAERFKAIQSAYFRPQFYAAIAEGVDYFQTAARLSSAIELSRFIRPRDEATFFANVDLIEADIRDSAA